MCFTMVMTSMLQGKKRVKRALPAWKHKIAIWRKGRLQKEQIEENNQEYSFIICIVLYTPKRDFWVGS